MRDHAAGIVGGVNVTTGMRVLLLEDQMMLAFAVKSTLEANGFSVVGPFPDIEGAQQASPGEDFDVALLDINLGNDTDSSEFADALMAQNVPFLFMTGYASSGPLDRRFSGIERLTKPVREADLLESLRELSAGGASR